MKIGINKRINSIPIVLFALVQLMAMSCSDTQSTKDKIPENSIPFKITATDTLRIYNFIDSLMAINNGVSISVSAGYKGEVLFSLARGFENIEDSTLVTPSSLYRLGSVSKVLGSTLLFKFIEDGQVALNDPIQKWIPDFPEKKYPITVGNILTHTSGIRHYNGHLKKDQQRHGKNFKTYTDALSIFKDDDLLYEPGTEFLYSSYGFNMVQGILENLTDRPIERIMDSLLFAPLYMSSTFVEVYGDRPPDLVYAYNNDSEDKKVTKARPGNPSYKKIAGGIVSTPEDMVRFMMALDNRQVIGDSTFDLMMQRPYEFAEWQAYGWRYGQRSKDSTVVYHHGGITRGFVALITFVPEKEIYVAVMANYNTFRAIRSDMAYFLIDLVNEGLLLTKNKRH